MRDVVETCWTLKVQNRRFDTFRIYNFLFEINFITILIIVYIFFSSKILIWYFKILKKLIFKYYK